MISEKLYFFVPWFFVLLTLSVQEEIKDGLLGSICSNDPNDPNRITCNEEHFLVCRGGGPGDKGYSCGCSDGMVGGSNRTVSCVGVVESPCQVELTTRPYIDCVRNAFCRNGTCDCKPGYDMAQSKNLCLIGYGSQKSCSHIHDCNYNKGLDCIGASDEKPGYCLCPDEHIWQPKADKCRVKIGSACDERNLCVENGVCSTDKKVCTCGGDFRIVASTHECKKDYGRTCILTGTDEHDCHPNFQCLPTGPDHKLTCGCRPGVEMYHNVAASHCDKVAGQDCIPDVTTCVPNASCRFGKCTCSDGFVADDLGHCVLNYGGDCSWSMDVCNLKAKMICGKDTRRCECQPGFEYQPHLKICLGLPKAPCETSTECHVLAECNLQTKKCECIYGYTSNSSDGRCHLIYDQPCSIEAKCNAYDFLRCDVVTQRCTCENSDMYYDLDGKACHAKVNTLCFLNAIDGRHLGCGQNGQCVRSSATISLAHGVCQCKPGFVSTAQGQCGQADGGGGPMRAAVFSAFIPLVLVSYKLWMLA